MTVGAAAGTTAPQWPGLEKCYETLENSVSSHWIINIPEASSVSFNPSPGDETCQGYRAVRVLAGGRQPDPAQGLAGRGGTMGDTDSSSTTLAIHIWG